MAEIVWAHEADCWLKNIFDYIADDDPVAAQGVVSGIYQQAQLLKDFPHLGHQYPHESGRDIRILLYGHYRIRPLSHRL